jgi:hypothetical protein
MTKMMDTTARGAVGSATPARSTTTCTDCGRHADVCAQGWQAYHVLELEPNEAPALAWYCPDCMEIFTEAVNALRAQARKSANASSLARC